MIADCIYEYIENKMSEKRRIHTYAVVKEAKRLARQYGTDVEKAELAALCHDFYRGIDHETLNDYVRKLGLSEKYLDNPNLAHGKIAAIMMEQEYQVTDEDVLNAVCYHTTGRANMTPLEKVIYIADAIEPNRSYPGVEELRDLAAWDLDEACVLSLNHVIDYVNSRGLYLDEDTIQARDSIKKEMKRKEGNV